MFLERSKYFIITLSFLFLTSSYTQAASFKAGGTWFSKDVKSLKEIKRKNIVPQSLDYSCGPAGLSTLFNYYLSDRVSEAEIITILRKTVPEERIRSRHGFSLLDLKNFAQSKGYKVTGYRMDEKFLRQLKEPVLVPIKFKNYHHFVIVKGVVDDRVFIADPFMGNLSLKVNKFMDMWTSGIGLVIERKGIDKKPVNFALKVDKEDFIIADYKMMNRLLDTVAYRTKIYPGEF